MQDGSLGSSEYFIDAILLNLITSLMDGHIVSSNLLEFLDRELSLEICSCSFSPILLRVYYVKIGHHKQCQDRDNMALLAMLVSLLYAYTPYIWTKFHDVLPGIN